MAIDPKEKKLIEQQIRNLEELIRRAKSGDPQIAGWKQQISNLKSRLRF